ncbi:MAG: amidase [Spirillospora sp.]
MTTDRPRTVTDAAAALRAGEVTSVGLTRAAIALADRADRALGVYVNRFDPSALDAAERADRELEAGLDRGPLHGIPIGVKDTIAVAEGPTTAQSVVLDRAWGARRDAPVVARLKAAGAVITGKTTAMEFACGMPDPAKPFPVPRNPWRPEAWTGGSSSGTAAGVAAGMFFAGLGSDTGGSIRMPAAFCGVTGLVPTFGLVPKSGCVPMAYSLDRIGPIARSARDCAALLEIMAGAHPSDPDSVRCPDRPPAPTHHQSTDELRSTDRPPAPTHRHSTDELRSTVLTGLPAADLSGVRVGVVREGHFPDGTDPALAGAFDKAVEVLAGLGASIRTVTLPYWEEMITALYVISSCEALAYHRSDLALRWGDYAPHTRGLIATGAMMSGADYVQAQRVRRVGQNAVQRLFGEIDVIACPTASVGAPLFDALAGDDGHLRTDALYPMIHTPYWSSLGTPVLAVPIGLTAGGLPLSMQLAGPAFGEAAILRAGDVFQQETNWHLRAPGLDDITEGVGHAR